MEFKRHLALSLKTFQDKLIFISGPRQAGKTFLIQHVLKPDLELNMDVSSDRLLFKKMPETILSWYEKNWGEFSKTKLQKNKPLVFLDEIHKVKSWRNLIKGTYDKTSHAIRYVASGSSAFQLRKQDKGDSLAGRAIWLTLFPLSFREYIETLDPKLRLPPPWKGQTLLKETLRALFPKQKRLRVLWNDYARYGSFPENLVKQNEVFFKQWLSDYQAAMLDRDLKDLHLGKDVERVYQVYELLLEGMGSTYSLRSLATTLGVSPNTIKSDILALKQVLWGFELPVIQASKAKQLRKEKKFYPMDFCFNDYQNSLATGSGFESTVASLLYRGLYSETSGFRSPFQLGFYRDYQKREVDFIFSQKNQILLSLECKLKLKQKSHQGLNYLQRYQPRESFLLVEEANVFEIGSTISAVSIELLAACLE